MNALTIYMAWPVMAYLAGSIPFGLIFVRWKARIDIRRNGSGNIGTTNVRRIAGNGWAMATLVCDVLKGTLPTWGAISLVEPGSQLLPAISALAAVLGHMFPVYFRFKPGGKGVATTLGAFMALTPLATVIALFVFICAVGRIRRVSAGSLIAAGALPVAIWYAGYGSVPAASGLVVMVMVIYRHAGNLKRLARGQEPTISEKRP